MQATPNRASDSQTPSEKSNEEPAVKRGSLSNWCALAVRKQSGSNGDKSSYSQFPVLPEVDTVSCSMQYTVSPIDPQGRYEAGF